jgi:hypothetical protein
MNRTYEVNIPLTGMLENTCRRAVICRALACALAFVKVGYAQTDTPPMRKLLMEIHEVEAVRECRGGTFSPTGTDEIAGTSSTGSATCAPQELANAFKKFMKEAVLAKGDGIMGCTGSARIRTVPMMMNEQFQIRFVRGNGGAPGGGQTDTEQCIACAFLGYQECVIDAVKQKSGTPTPFSLYRFTAIHRRVQPAPGPAVFATGYTASSARARRLCGDDEILSRGCAENSACFDGTRLTVRKNGMRDSCPAITGTSGAPTPAGLFCIRREGEAQRRGGLRGLAQDRSRWYLIEPQFTTSRSRMHIHAGIMSAGCITVTDRGCFGRIEAILNSPGTVTGTGYDGYPPGNTEGVANPQTNVTCVGWLLVTGTGGCK